MAWSTPVTVVTGDVIAAAWGNTYVRDNLRYLKGLDGAVTIENSVTVQGNLVATGGSSSIIGTVSGNGSGLTSLNASNLSSGTVPVARLPTDVVLDGQNITRLVNNAGYLTGSSSLNADNITTGTLAQNRLPSFIRSATHTLGVNAVSQLLPSLDKPGGLCVAFADQMAYAPALFGLTNDMLPLCTLLIAHGLFTHGQNTSGKINIYWSSSNNRYEIQNTTSVTQTVRVIILGYPV